MIWLHEIVTSVLVADFTPLLALMKQVAMLERSMSQEVQLSFHIEGHFREF